MDLGEDAPLEDVSKKVIGGRTEARVGLVDKGAEEDDRTHRSLRRHRQELLERRVAELLATRERSRCDEHAQ